MRRLIAAIAASTLMLAPATQATADAGIDAGTNALRQQNGLVPLVTDASLSDAAHQRAQAIVSNFAHDYSWGNALGCQSWGENIAWISLIVGSDWAVNAWWDSPPHRSNMLGGFAQQGSALVHVNGRTYAVQLFGTGCGGVSAPPAPVELPDTALPAQ